MRGGCPPPGFRLLLSVKVSHPLRIHDDLPLVSVIGSGLHEVHRHAARVREVWAGDEVSSAPADDDEVPHLEALPLVEVEHRVVDARGREELPEVVETFALSVSGIS